MVRAVESTRNRSDCSRPVGSHEPGSAARQRRLRWPDSPGRFAMHVCQYRTQTVIGAFSCCALIGWQRKELASGCRWCRVCLSRLRTLMDFAASMPTLSRRSSVVAVGVLFAGAVVYVLVGRARSASSYARIRRPDARGHPDLRAQAPAGRHERSGDHAAVVRIFVRRASALRSSFRDVRGRRRSADPSLRVAAQLSARPEIAGHRRSRSPAIAAARHGPHRTCGSTAASCGRGRPFRSPRP